jgi:hypothetical protein
MALDKTNGKKLGGLIWIQGFGNSCIHAEILNGIIHGPWIKGFLSKK